MSAYELPFPTYNRRRSRPANRGTPMSEDRWGLESQADAERRRAAEIESRNTPAEPATGAAPGPVEDAGNGGREEHAGDGGAEPARPAAVNPGKALADLSKAARAKRAAAKGNTGTGKTGG